MSYSTNFINKPFCGYLVFFLLFFLLRNEAQPAWYDWSMQLLTLFAGWGLVSFFIHRRFSTTTYVCLFFYHVLMAFIMRGIDMAVYGDPLGAYPMDADSYRLVGEQLGDKSFDDLFHFWELRQTDIDDRGYPFIVWFAYSLFGKIGLHVIILFNGLAIVWGTVMLYRLMCRFVHCSLAKMFALLWGVMPYAIFTSSTGLKENFFAFFVIFAFYHGYICYERRSMIQLVLTLVGISSIFLFRLALGYAAILAFLSYYFLKSRFVRQHTKLSFCIILLSVLPLFPILSNYVMEQRGYSYENLSQMSESKILHSGGVVGQVTNVVAGFIGPIPNYVSSDPVKRTYITRYTFTPFFKMCVSFFFLYAAYFLLFRKFNVMLIPPFVFIALNIVTMLFTFMTLHDRYHWPDIPLFFVTCAWGMEQFIQYGRQSKYIFYLCVAALIIIAFNLR